MADAICSTGKWVDIRTGWVVDSEPVEGRLLVSPGGQVTPDVNAAIERAMAGAPVVETATVDAGDVEDGQTVEDVETATVPVRKETAAMTPKRRGS